MAKKTSTAVMMMAVLLLSACNFPLFSSSNEEDTNALSTAVAETVQALNAQPDSQSDALSEGLPTLTPLPTDTPPVVQAPPTQTPLPCNKALFLSETIPDDTVFASGEAFTKSWTFKNIGTCTWNTDYKLVFATGDAMSGPASVNLASAVAPNAQVTISVDLTAPTDEGTYKGDWKLQADDDEPYAVIWVKVKTELVFFKVMSVSYSMADTTIDITCPGNLSVSITAEITTSAGGVVSFKWDDSQGCLSGCVTKSMNFASAETKSITHSMTVGAAGDYWAKIYIDEPNHQWFGQENFHVDCN